MDIQKDIRIAVLIDADNVVYSNIKGVMEEISPSWVNIASFATPALAAAWF